MTSRQEKPLSPRTDRQFHWVYVLEDEERDFSRLREMLRANVPETWTSINILWSESCPPAPRNAACPRCFPAPLKLRAREFKIVRDIWKNGNWEPIPAQTTLSDLSIVPWWTKLDSEIPGSVRPDLVLLDRMIDGTPWQHDTAADLLQDAHYPEQRVKGITQGCFQGRGEYGKVHNKDSEELASDVKQILKSGFKAEDQKTTGTRNTGKAREVTAAERFMQKCLDNSAWKTRIAILAVDEAPSALKEWAACETVKSPNDRGNRALWVVGPAPNPNTCRKGAFYFYTSI